MQSLARTDRHRLPQSLHIQLACALAAAFALACTIENAAENVQPPVDTTRAARAVDAPVVILLSLDGIRHDYLDLYGLPAFSRMTAEGTRADRLLPVFPSITFPTHVSLATGTYPDVHGIVGNRFWDSARSGQGRSGEEYDYSGDANWLKAEPIWVAAERQGIPAAVFFWVGSETDWRGTGATHRKAPFDSGVSEAEKVDQILAWMDMPSSDPKRPGLILAYWHGTDRAGHRQGADSEAVREALLEQDHQLGRLLGELDARAVWPHTTLLVVSDHGMIEAGDAINAAELLSDAGIRARTIHASAVAHIHLEDVGADKVRAVDLLTATAGVTAYAAADFPRDLRYAHSTRTGDVIALATPPYVFSSKSQALGARMLRAVGNRPGMHGYDVRAVPEMAGIFLARGRGVHAGGSIGDVRGIDVAATVATLLGIDAPAQSEGKAIALEPH